MMPAALRHPWVVRGAQLAIGVVFLVAGLSKIGDLGSFAEQVHNFRLAPIAGENLIALALPWIEIVAALALLLRVEARGGAWVVAGLMVAFTLAVLQGWLRGLDIACGCFGTADASRVGLTKLVENVGLTALALVACLRPKG